MTGRFLAPAVALMALVWGGVPAQAPRARVLVMPFTVDAAGLDAGAAAATRWLGEAASTLLAEELNALGYRALPREDRVDVFDRLRLPMSSELTHATLIRVGELIGASEVVFGEVRVGETLTVLARTIHLDGGRLLPDVTDAGDIAGMYDLFARVAGRVGRQTGPPPYAATGRSAPMPLPALETFIRGLTAPTPAATQRFLESAMTQAPRDARVLTALWAVYADQDLHDKALSVASAVPPDAPEARLARWQVALSLIELRRFDGAVKLLADLHAETGEAAASAALGIVELRRGSPAGTAERAGAFFDRAATEAPDDVDVRFNLGYARAVQGDHARALAALREVVRRNAADGDAHLVMASVLAAAGKPTESQRELELARLLGTSLDTLPAAAPRVPPAALERVPARLASSGPGLPASAASTQRDQLDTAQFHLERARDLLASGRDRDAILELSRSVYLSPYDAEPHLLLGGVYHRAGRLNDAIDEFRVAIWSRESAAARIALGRALLDAGDREAARVEVERALVLAPNSTGARELLQRIGGEIPANHVLPSSADHD
jgi:tetratricopeptide (TPR) repeat protein